MDESKLIELYKAGMDAVISSVKSMHKELNTQILNLNTEIVHLNKEITHLNKKVIHLNAENMGLSSKLIDLETKINQNSNNSSKPPSSGPFNKPTNSRKKTDKKTGGQEGHKGTTLLKVENPDIIIENILDVNKCDCGCDLSNIDSYTRTRQVFDIPKIVISVTEYRSEQKECPHCKKVHKAGFPQEVTQPVQYGENMQALISYLTNYQLIPLNRASEMIYDIIGQKISQGTIININKRFSDNLSDVEEAIKNNLKNADIVHFDETGMRKNGKNNWVHSASTETVTHYAMHEKRGTNATEEIGILPEFKGVAVHDHWKSYYKYTDCCHAECNAHHIRTLRGIHENGSFEWANNMIELLVEIKEEITRQKSNEKDYMPETLISAYTTKYQDILTKGRLEDAEKSPVNLTKSGKPRKSEALKLINRLEEYDIETLSFMYDFQIPFDNNLAERDIRMIKLRQKISGCFRGEDGGDMFCKIRSYISTCRKNGLSVIDSIKDALKGMPYIPESV